ncbi:MAG TPA: ABC transporter permease [Candidatus Levilactobacillus faecigallinarum]|uniref:ABC transporter permease n=1 Tax=Candidatus Levilactobacillus faecigallinarum TaxID=2838638 RepID=A0A9D1QU99_9LACO|nr:ABC transporter permease [Candidatus Levilactobacillus faecigallinarum]
MSNRLKIFLPFSSLIFLVLLVPIVVMLFASFQSATGGFSLTNYHQIVVTKYYRDAVFNSFKVSLVAAVVSLIIAIIGATALTQLKQGTKQILVTIFNMSSSFAGVPLAFSLIILFGNAGVLRAIFTALHLTVNFNLYSLTGATLAFTFFEIPLGIMFLFPVFEELNPEWQEVSAVLGAKPWFFLRHVILPVIFPNLIEVFTLLFANAMGTYETTFALTGNNVVTIPTLIGALINGEMTANVPLACAFATLFAVTMTVIVWLGNRLTHLKKRGDQGA